jgi:hypothetical protein
MRVVPDFRDMQDNERVWPDFGDVRDNETALRIALSKIEHDDRAWGCGVLVCLRDHLCTTHDAQSIQWMLPHVEAALQRFCSPTPHTTNENGAEPHQAELTCCVAHVHVRLRGVLPWCARHAGRGRTMWRACTSSRWVRRERRHRDTPGEDARHPRCSGELCLALSPGGAVAHDRGVRRALLESVHAAPATPLGRTEGGMPVLWECIVWHHTGLSMPPRA